MPASVGDSGEVTNRIGAALRLAYSGRVTQVVLAKELGRAQNTISHWVTGTTTPSLDEIALFEAACGRPLGWVLRAAGYVSDDEGVEAAIANDARLSDQGRLIVLGAYRAALASSGTPIA